MNERNKQLEAVLVAAKEWQNTITDVPTTIEAIDVDTALCDAIAAANDRF